MKPTLIDGTTQLVKLRESSNSLRLVTDFMTGIGSMMILKTIFFRTKSVTIVKGLNEYEFRR